MAIQGNNTTKFLFPKFRAFGFRNSCGRGNGLSFLAVFEYTPQNFRFRRTEFIKDTSVKAEMQA
jgi:hypothetical protein